MKRTSGGATFTPVTIDEVKKIVFRAFHSLDPKMSSVKGEIGITLSLNDARTVEVMVMTSVHGSSSQGASRGSDAMRVGIWGAEKKRFLKTTEMVKRTQGWKDTLQRRIEDAIEEYDDDPARWEKMADPSWRPMSERGPEPPPRSTPPPPSHHPTPVVPQTPYYGGGAGRPATDKQIRYLKFLLMGMSNSEWASAGFARQFGLDEVPRGEILQDISFASAYTLIDALKRMGRGESRSAGDFSLKPNTAFSDAVVGYIFEGGDE